MTHRRAPFLNRRFIQLSIPMLMFAAIPSATLHGGDAKSTQWPYGALTRPAVPVVKQAESVRNPIDAFIIARLERAKLQPNPSADRGTLLRRVTFDLTGLMPTAAEREAFLRDASAGAYERVVDRLLASPHFGERWAQHWLDVVRYAETEGYKVDRLRPDAYRYRDYVIRAFNQDLPYDRFLSQQIAGDELEPGNPDALVATGFWRLHMEESNGANYCRIRQDILDDNTDVLGSAVLGLTFGCARCHNHKFDPITQNDYFRLQAFITPLIHNDELCLVSADERAKYDRQYAVWERATLAFRTEADKLVQGPRDAIFEELIVSLDPETQVALRLPLEKRTALQKQIAVLAGKQITNRQARAHRRLPPDKRAIYDGLQKKIAELDNLKPAPLPMAMGVVDVGLTVPPTRLLGGGNHLRPREVVEPGFPRFLTNEAPDIHAPAAQPGSSGRRTALARWLCRPDHPLTARVVANRLWQHYFGDGIVGTPNDFGVMGEHATHPELLDYVASDLVKNGWRLKSLHRLIVTSATYMQASSTDLNPTELSGRRQDRGNDLLWHANSRRRDAESLRDAMLQVSGQLNTRMFGESALPELPAPVSETRYAWYADEREEDRNRRSVYISVRRNMPYPLLAVFDAPDRLNSCPTRAVTTSAPQALALLNSKFTLVQSQRMAGLLLERHGSDAAALIRDAHLLTYNREPSSEELAAAQRFFEKQSGAAMAAASGPMPAPMPCGIRPALASAIVDFCHALLNSAEFLYVD